SRRSRTQSGCICRAPPPDSPATRIQEIGALLSSEGGANHGARSTGSTMGSTLRNLTAAGIATRCGMRRLASSWFSVVVPSQTCGQPSPQSAGSISRMFCGLFVSRNQSSAGVERISDHKSTRHDFGTLLSKTSRIKGLQELDEPTDLYRILKWRRHAARTSVGAFCQNGLNRAAASEHSDLRRRARWTATGWSESGPPRRFAPMDWLSCNRRPRRPVMEILIRAQLVDAGRGTVAAPLVWPSGYS